MVYMMSVHKSEKLWLLHEKCDKCRKITSGSYCAQTFLTEHSLN